jgi:hypothetical protein
MCILPQDPLDANGQDPADSPEQVHAARSLSLEDRHALALAALSGQPIAHLAAAHHVSRKFVYLQLHIAQNAVARAFSPPDPNDDSVLFYLPVTKAWIRQLVLGLVLICHSSVRGTVELLADVFAYHLSIGTIHNIVHEAVATARQHNLSQDLSNVAIGAPDEIFQAGLPIVVGVDVYSTYCYLLSVEDHRDADTWGVRLLELAERGFHPDATVADAGAALRSGQKQALPGVPCRGDIFHALYEISPLVRYVENRVYEIIATVDDLNKRQANHRWRKGRKSMAFSQKLRYAQAEMSKAITLADDVATLVSWLRRDVFAVSAATYQERADMYDFIVDELWAREEQCPQRIAKVRTLLENQEEDLLGFAEQMDEDVARLGREWQVSEATVREMLHAQTLPMSNAKHWEEEKRLWQELGGRYYGLREAVKELRDNVVRASSVVENLNSRLRNYFFLRKQVGGDYLSLLQFFLNHRKYQRSEHAEREGKSPAELLNGKEHAHWLELLGHKRFSRN